MKLNFNVSVNFLKYLRSKITIIRKENSQKKKEKEKNKNKIQQEVKNKLGRNPFIVSKDPTLKIAFGIFFF